jgi:hypothetical protein
MMRTLADMTVRSTDLGKKEFTLEFTETTTLSKL